MDLSLMLYVKTPFTIHKSFTNALNKVTSQSNFTLGWCISAFDTVTNVGNP